MTEPIISLRGGNSVNVSTGALTVASWESYSTFPPAGYSVNATVFKWQKE
jgi:hypothetical protein